MIDAKPWFKFDDLSSADAADHMPELYKPGSAASPLRGLRSIGADAEAFYRDRGYFTVADAFTRAEVEEALEAIDDLVAGRNESFNDIYYENASRKGIEQLDAKARLDKVRKLAGFTKYDERLERMGHKPELLEIAARLLGGKTPRLFKEMALLKPPMIGREKPWHQDHAYFDVDLSERVVGVWIALDQALVENGCMQVLDGGHQRGPIIHWKIRDWQICDADMIGRSSVACPLDPGGAMFFDSLLPHGTPTNHSSLRRRALQFHYIDADAASIPAEQRLAVFGADGKDVTC